MPVAIYHQSIGALRSATLRPLPFSRQLFAAQTRSCSIACRPSIQRSAYSRSRQPVRFQSTVTDALSSTTAPPPSSPSSATAAASAPKKSLPRRIFSLFLIATFSFALGAGMAAAPAVAVANELLSAPTDAESLELFKPDPASAAGLIEAELQAHPLVTALRQDGLLSESRPHMKMPPTLRTHNFTGGTLLGEDMLGVPPLAFVARDGSRFVSFHHLGPALCGHPGIVHGGLLATLLDEGLARCCFPALPNKVGMTASLNISYKAPCKANQFVVMKAETTKVEGRKAWVKGRLETLVDESKGEVPLVLVEAEALFIEPRQAAQMAKIYANN